MGQLKFNGLNWLDRSSSHKLEQITWNKERMVAIFAKECTVGFLLEIVRHVLPLKAPRIFCFKTVNKCGWSQHSTTMQNALGNSWNNLRMMSS